MTPDQETEDLALDLVAHLDGDPIDDDLDEGDLDDLLADIDPNYITVGED